MDLALIPAMANLVATACAFMLVVIAVLIVFVMLAAKVASKNWWTY